jgi:hypothetical protein
LDEKGNSRPRVNNKGPLKVTMSEHPQNRAEVVGLWAGTLAATEVGLGSILHGLHVPLAGSMLSLNQAAFLTRATRTACNYQTARTLPFEISSITAVLKSFSPIGKKLTPMLAITAQGALFTIGTFICGANLLGVMLGAVLLATWGIVQPLALAGLMFSALSDGERHKIVLSWHKLTAELPFLNSENIMTALGCFLLLKSVLALGIAVATWKLPNKENYTWFSHLVRRLTIASVAKGPLPILSVPDYLTPTPPKSFKEKPLIQALRDLRNPFVLSSIAILTALALLVDSDLVATFWIALRAIGAAYVTYLILRWLPWERILSGDSASQNALRAAIRQLQALQFTKQAGSSNVVEKVRP